MDDLKMQSSPTVPARLLAGIQETEIGFLPEDWEIAEVGELGQIITGTTPRTKVPEYYEGHSPSSHRGIIGANRLRTKNAKASVREGFDCFSSTS